MNLVQTVTASRGRVSLEAIDRFLDRALVWRAICAAVLLLQIVLAVTHRPWLDEYQALQLAVQSPDFPTLLANLRYEGHPPLWYLVLQAAALVVPLGWVLATAQLPIAVAIQCLILARAPASRLERLLFATSFFVLIDYGVLSRSLSLGVLLTLVAFLYRGRPAGWIALALMPLVDFLFGALSLALLLLVWVERRFSWAGAAIWLFASLVAAWTVRPAPDVVPAFFLTGPVTDSLFFLLRLGALFLPLHMNDGALVWNAPPPFPVALPGGIMFLFLGRMLLNGDRLGMALFFAFAAVCWLFSILVYPLAIRHVSLCALLLVLLVWRRRARGEVAGRSLFLCWLALASACGLTTAALNLVRPFDTAREAALYIRTHGLADRHWVSLPESRGQGVAALLGIQTEWFERNCLQSFVSRNYRNRIADDAGLEQELARIARRSGRYYLMTAFPLSGRHLRAPGNYRLLTRTGPGYVGQPFYLYEVHGDLPERPVPLPQCAPALPPRPML